MSADSIETRRAIRLVAWVALATVLIYAAVSFFVTEDSFFARYGLADRSRESMLRSARSMMYTRQHIEAFDRDAHDGPMLYLLGSSIAREGLDAARIEERLRRKSGLDYRVVIFAFDRGTPIFQWALLDELDPRPGDLMFLPINYDQFVKNWHNDRTGVDLYIHHLLDPNEVVQVRALRGAERAEYTLASFWPHSFQRARDQYRIGLENWLNYAIGLDDEPYYTDDFEGHPFGSKIEVATFRRNQIKRRLLRVRKGRMRLDEQQINYQGLVLWHQAVLDLGAVPITGFLPMAPGNPPEGLTDKLWPHPSNVVAFHEHMTEHFQPWVALRQPRFSHFIDYKHVNHLGRRRYSDQLADLLVDSLDAQGSFDLVWDGGGWVNDPLNPE